MRKIFFTENLKKVLFIFKVRSKYCGKDDIQTEGKEANCQFQKREKLKIDNLFKNF